MKDSANNMLHRYLQAVGFWLPRRQKDDILAELSEDLHSQIEERETDLGRPLEEADIAAILKQRGRPILVAGRFLPQQHLIGPMFFPIYVFVLKIVALCYLVPWILVWIGFLIFDQAQSAVHISTPLHALGSLWTVLFTQFGIITLIFAALDRASTQAKLLDDWDPRKLPALRAKQQTRRRGEAIAGIVFGILGIFWLLAVPNFPFLILGPAAFFLKAAPIWQTVFTPILVLAVATIAQHLLTLLRPQLTWVRPGFHLGTTALSLWIAYMLLQTRTYILPVNPQMASAAAATNLAILIGIFCAVVGLLIGLCIHAWQLVQELRRSTRPSVASLA